MASIIRVKRSTGTTAPGSLQFGELGLTIGAGTQANKGERLFVGDNAGNVDVVGGRYFTDLMVHAPGTVASVTNPTTCLLYTSPSPRDRTRSRMPSSA